MPKTKKEKRVLYYTYFEGENLGEAQGFFEINKGKLKYVDGWFLNDAQYRDEYMSGLFSYLGVIIERLPEKHRKKAEKLMEEAYGL